MTHYFRSLGSSSSFENEEIGLMNTNAEEIQGKETIPEALVLREQ
jgi:hypothetical protein